MALVTASLAGLIFGLGLIISGMANPERILGFLDVSGQWDPSLLLVMTGALAVSIIPFQIAKKRQVALLGMEMQLPKQALIEKRLILGSVLFGAGWGLAGYCPGPALVSLLSGQPEPWIFVVSMLAGMLIHRQMESKQT